MEEMNNNENLNTETQAEQVAETTTQASDESAVLVEQTPVEASEPVQEKKPNNAVKFIIPIAVLIVLVLILVGVAAATGKFGGNGKKKVADAVIATFTQSGEAIKNVWGLDEYKGMFEDKQMSLDADFTINGGAGLEVQYNMNDKVSGIYMDVSYFGSSLINATLYMDEEELSLGIPYYIDYVFYVDRTTLEEDIQNLVDEGRMDEETAEALTALNQGSQDLNGADEEIKQGALDILDALKNIYNKAEVKKADSKTLEVDGEDRNCTGYVTTITGQQVAEFMLAYKDVYEENEAFRNYFNQMLAVEAGFDSVEEFLEYTDPVEEFQNLADEASESEDKLDLYFYLYNGVVAQIYVEADEDNYLEWNVKGGNFPLENTEIKFVADGDENTLIRSGSINDDTYTANYAFDILDEEINFEVEYNKNSGDFAVEIYDYYSDFALSGNIDKSIPGSELIIEIESVEMDNEELFYGDVTISNECGEIEKPEGDVLNVMKLTEDEWYDIMEEILYNM